MNTTTATTTATTKAKNMTLSLSLSPPSPDEIGPPHRRDSLFAGPSSLSPPYQDYDAVSPLTVPSSSPFIPPPSTKPHAPSTSLPSPPTTPKTTKPPSPLFPAPKPETHPAQKTTPLYTPFDRHSPSASTTPYHGFFTLLWIAVFFFVVKVSADNYLAHGHPLGGNEILRGLMMSDRQPWELLVLAGADLAMCAATGVTFLVQRGVRWEGWGAGVQVVSVWFSPCARVGVLTHVGQVWQMVFVAGVIGTPLWRGWGWSQTVFFVMHGLVMVMKQHSYAWYNGYLSTVEGRRRGVKGMLEGLEGVKGGKGETADLAQSATVQRRKSVKKPEVDTVGFEEPLDEDQAQVLECMLRWEVDALTDELRGKATSADRAYPRNLTAGNFYEFIGLPTLVYELEYPRCDGVDWWYAAEKAAACFGVLFVMVLVSQTYIYPVVMDTVRWKDEGMPLAERFAYFPQMLLRLVFPFMMEYLLAWYLIWETILNFVAEVTRFADRRFYDAWWNSVSWDQFARDWNRPVHEFLRRHVYYSSISAMKVDKHTATLMTFFLSACAHELVMWCIFKKLRGYLLLLQMFQLPVSVRGRLVWWTAADCHVVEAGEAEPDEMVEGQGGAGERHVLVWHIYWAESSLQSVFDPLSREDTTDFQSPFELCINARIPEVSILVVPKPGCRRRAIKVSGHVGDFWGILAGQREKFIITITW